MVLPFGPLRFLYIGSSDIGKDVAFFRETLGAERVWHFDAFDAQVAAFRVGEGPLVLLADHRPAKSCIPVYEVDDLVATAKALKRRGWKPEGAKFGLPNGDAYLFQDPSGNEYCIFEDERPGALEEAYKEPDAEGAVR